MADGTKEMSLNGKLAEYLRREGLDAVEEQTLRNVGGNRHQVDVLVDLDEYAVALEAEFAPGNGQKDALRRLTDPPLQWRGLPVLAVYAITYPKRLQRMVPSEAYEELNDADDLMFCHRMSSSNDWSENVVGSVKVLAGLLHDYWAKSDNGQNIETVVTLTSNAIDNAREALKDKNGERGSDPAATKALVWLNALLFQELLSKKLDSKTLPEEHKGKQIPRPEPDRGVSHLLEQWEYILAINWWPIFHVARESLKQTPPNEAGRALVILKSAAAEIAEAGVIRRHDVAGRIFHRLLDTRKFLATNYTTISAAILLAGLAFDDKHPLWRKLSFADPEVLKKLKIVDPACGSGTLLMAAAQEISKRIRRDSESEKFHTKAMLENSLYGFDVVPAAIHLASSTLSMAENSQLITNMNLWRMHHGILNGVPRLGSLDMLKTSVTQGNAEQLGLFDDADDGIRISGQGERKEKTVKFPRECDLIITNPPYTRAGGPGDEANTDWNPIFGSLLDSNAQKRMKKALNAALKKTPAGVYSGLGSAFLLLADENIKGGGRIAFVLPSAVITGSSWKPMREMLLRNYEIDWVVTSHDPRQRNSRGGLPGRIYASFSESTSISETLLVATRTKGHPDGKHHVRFVNLRQNPTSTIDALSLARSLLEIRSNGTEILIGGKSRGEIRRVRQTSLTSDPWVDTSFVQSKLLDIAKDLAKGNFHGHNIPLANLSDSWKFGPYEMQIKHPVQGLFDCDESHDPMRSGYPAIWHHSANSVNSLETTANAHLTPKSKKSTNEQKIMLQRSSKLQLARELRHNTQKIAAVVTDKPMLGVRSWISLKPVKATPGGIETLCLWLNSTPGLLLRFIHANLPYPGRSLVTHTNGAKLKVIDVGTLSEKQLLEGLSAYMKLRKLEMKSIHHMNRDDTRRKVDIAVCSLLELPSDSFEEIADMMVREPNINAGKSNLSNI